MVRNGTTEGSFDITGITDTNTPGATIKKKKNNNKSNTYLSNFSFICFWILVLALL